MDYEGILVEESLKDKSVLDSLFITSTQVEPVTVAHRTPWLKHWTLHAILVPAEDAAIVALQLGVAIDRGGWYADYRNNTTHFVIFPGKIFKIDRQRPEHYAETVAYGVSIGIPEYQLDFGPVIPQWERPAGN
jgi:hypothetical protein